MKPADIRRYQNLLRAVRRQPQRPSRPALPGEAGERIAHLSEITLAGLHPNAGEGWDARSLPPEGSRM
jgi:hypothetical protein